MTKFKWIQLLVLCVGTIANAVFAVYFISIGHAPLALLNTIGCASAISLLANYKNELWRWGKS